MHHPPAHPLTFSVFVVAVFLFFFGGVPGFRDGAHFYGPLFEYLAQETAAGRLPLWNPYENLGQPLAANPTTLFFYPPTLLVLGISRLVTVDIGTLYGVFTGFHLFLALFTSYRLARSWRCGREAASFAALAYTLGGNVLFQWNNIPFLIGAAWFPELFRQGDRLICHGKTRYLIGLAVVAALTILGGDPQAVYHAALCLLVLLAFRYRDSRTTARSLRQLALAGFFAFLLAGIQILPAVELGIHSDRQLETHRTWLHAFSVPPWRLLEFLWPNAGGRQFPENARWVSAFNFERGIWTPSLYMGLLPAVLAISAVWRIRLLRSRQWSAAILLLLVFLFGALGDGFCVYSILERLPGYDMFRYPGKLMTVASLFLALLAARGFDIMERNPAFFRRFRFVLSFYALPIGVASAMAIFGADWFPEVPACPLFGPFNVEKARFVLGFSAVSVLLVVSSVFAVGIYFSRRHGAHGKIDRGANSPVPPCHCERKYFARIFLLIAALDVCAANTWLLATLPSGEKPSLPTIETAAPIRIYRYPVWYPPSFGKTSSANRLAEAVEWDRRTLFPRYSLPRRLNVVDVRGTLMTKTWHPVAGKLRQELRQELRSEKPGNFEFEKHLARLGVRYVIAPDGVRLNADRIVSDGDAPEDVTFWEIRQQIRTAAPREFVRYEPNRIVFDVSLAQPAAAVVTEQFWPGWRAFLADGQEIPIHAVDDVFRGVDLPAGTHRVTMVYDPLSLKLGAALTLCGVLVVFLIARRDAKTQR